MSITTENHLDSLTKFVEYSFQTELKLSGSRD